MEAVVFVLSSILSVFCLFAHYTDQIFFPCSSLGKPRRFSDNFLAVEKEKLEDYREKVRKIYAQLRDGSRDSLPADLARPFSIGQEVIVRHPSSRELCDGKVVMMGPDCYKVHFINPDLGVNIVKVCTHRFFINPQYDFTL